MLEQRYIAGRHLYRAPGTLVWSYSRADAIERAKQGVKIYEEASGQRVISGGKAISHRGASGRAA
jgi:hypothetical protein